MKQLKTISNKTIRKFNPCYNPSTVTDSESERLSIRDWVEKYRTRVKSPSDILWLLCRNDFLSDRDLRLFAVWCARSTYALCTEDRPVDPLSVAAVDMAERFANGLCTESDLSAARSAAWSAAESAAWSAARSAAWSAAESAAESAAWSAAESAAWSAQIDQLLTYFKD